MQSYLWYTFFETPIRSFLRKIWEWCEIKLQKHVVIPMKELESTEEIGMDNENQIDNDLIIKKETN